MACLCPYLSDSDADLLVLALSFSYLDYYKPLISRGDGLNNQHIVLTVNPTVVCMYLVFSSIITRTRLDRITAACVICLA